MSLAETLSSKLAEWRPTSPGRATFTHEDAASGWSVALVADKADALSCQLWSFTLEKLPAPKPG